MGRPNVLPPSLRVALSDAGRAGGSLGMLAAVLDAWATPMFLLEAPGVVVHRNAAAQAVLRSGWMLLMGDGGLRPAHHAAAAPLAEAIRHALAGHAVAGPPHVVSLGDGQEGRRVVAAILPLPCSGPPGDTSTRPNAAVLLHDPDAMPVPDVASFGSIHGLTRAECRFLACIAVGNGVPAAATALGISVATGRSHLKAIFGKTGTSSQASLTRLVTASTLPLSIQPRAFQHSQNDAADRSTPVRDAVTDSQRGRFYGERRRPTPGDRTYLERRAAS